MDQSVHEKSRQRVGVIIGICAAVEVVGIGLETAGTG
jgi:hypothetical protein